MATVKASEATPGAIYKRTRTEMGGIYYKRPKVTSRTNPKRMVNRLEEKGEPLAGFWRSVLKKYPNAVLLKEYHRGRCIFSGKRWELTRWVLMAPDAKLRAVKRPPGYS